MYHPLPKAYFYSAHEITATFDDYGTTKTREGTAFLANTENGKYFLVTNRHVLDPSFPSGVGANHWTLTGVSIRGFGHDFMSFEGNISGIPEPFYSIDKTEDIAVLRVRDLKAKTTGGRKSVNSIPISLMANQQYFATLLAGDFIAMPGYPEWRDRQDGRPILRSGTLASEPMSGYTGPTQESSPRRRLIEAFSFGGSSGSPVFALALGMRGDVVTDNFRELRLIGINAGHLQVKGRGDHSGLSFMFTSIAIVETIEAANRSDT